MSSLTLKSILLIDDDEISNLFNKIFIGKLELDVPVEIALNGAEALKLLKGRITEDDRLISAPCLLLLDIRMPVMDGWGFLEAYETLFTQKIKNQIIIVVLTTSEDEGDMLKAMKNNTIKEIIKKPLSDNKFKDLITKFFVEETTL